MKRVKVINRVFFSIGAVLAVLYAFPFFLVLLNSFKEKRDIRNDPLSLPDEWLFANYAEAADKMDYWISLGNSILITVFSVFAIIFTSSLLAYYLARKKTKFTAMTFLILVSSMIVPFQALMIPFVGLFGYALSGDGNRCNH